MKMSFEEPKLGNENNEYGDGFRKDEGREEMSDGMGLERPNNVLNDFPGSEGSSQKRLYAREVARFEELRRKAFGRATPITNAGIVLDSFGGAFGESGQRVNRGRGEDNKGEQEF